MGYWLASRWRRLIQNPSVILAPLVSEGMIVLEPGPGMGAFTLELARRVGPKGRVIAVDIQPKMLEVLVRRASKAGLAGWIEARQPKGDHLGVEDFQGRVDFALAFAMVHEVPKPELLFGDIRAALKGGGKLLLAEPCGHVKAKAFEATMDLARKSGFVLESRPAIRWNHSALLTRA
jgi:ubiquinone/menaquinone biosynthesis C-methylase UbiE